MLDFDGLLVDTERVHQAAYKKALENWGFSLSIDFSLYTALTQHPSGTQLRDYVYNSYPELTGRWTELRNQKLQIYSELIQEQVPLMPFASEFLSATATIPRCVVTNSPRLDVDCIRRHQPILNTITHWITREDYPLPKPAPDGYLKGLSLFPHIAPHEAMGFEDTLKGVEALKAAGARPILVSAKGQFADLNAVCIHFGLSQPQK